MLDLLILAAVLLGFAGGLHTDRQLLLALPLSPPAPVCHALTEDSVITDCRYYQGAWHLP